MRARQPGFDLEEALQGSVVVLTLVSGLESEAKAQDLAQRLLQGGGPDRARLLVRLLHRLYAAPAGSGRYVGGLEPDLLGEELVWEVLRSKGQVLEVALDLAEPEGSASGEEKTPLLSSPAPSRTPAQGGRHHRPELRTAVSVPEGRPMVARGGVGMGGSPGRA
jgi:hypothetical protein